MKIGFNILEILQSYLIIIRINIDHEENKTIIKEQKVVDVSMVKISFLREKDKWMSLVLM